MWSLIYKLQRKPESVRQHIAFFGAATVTGVIALLWLISRFTTGSAVPASNTSATVQKSTGPLAAFSNALGSFISDTRVSIAEFRKGLGGAETVYQKKSAEAEERP